MEQQKDPRKRARLIFWIAAAVFVLVLTAIVVCTLINSPDPQIMAPGPIIDSGPDRLIKL